VQYDANGTTLQFAKFAETERSRLDCDRFSHDTQLISAVAATGADRR
jgi:hypothetical protein